MSTKTIAKSFVKEVIALLQGDTAEVTAQRILRQADSAFKTYIPSLEGDTMSLEDDVENAREKLRLAKLNQGQEILDKANYISNFIFAKNNLKDAEENLQNHLEMLNFLREEYKTLNQ